MSGEQLRLAALLGACFAALVLALAWRAGQPRVRTEDGDTVLWTLRRDEVRAVEVSGPGGAWTLTRGPEGDRVRGVGVHAASREAVADLVDALEEAGRGEAVAAPGARGFGLEAPTRVVVDRDGDRLAVDVGEDGVGGRTYVAAPGGPVLAVHGGIGRAVRVPESALWARDLWPQDADAVEVRVGERVVGAARREGDRWRWTVAVDDRPASAWIVALEDVRVDRWEAPAGPAVGEVVVWRGGEADRLRLHGGPGAWWLAWGDGRAGAVGTQLDDLW